VSRAHAHVSCSCYVCLLACLHVGMVCDFIMLPPPT
jgi:hypothetical protein